MPIKVLELHHHGIRIGKSAEDVSKAQEFYTDMLGLQADGPAQYPWHSWLLALCRE